MLPELTDRLLGQWSLLFPEFARPSSIHYMGLPGSVEGGTASFVAFVQGRRDPMFVVKVHREPGANERNDRERAVLTRLASCNSHISEAVPRVLFSEEVRGRSMLVQSVLPGTPMAAPMQRSGLPEVRSADHSISAVSDWLLALYRETGVTSADETAAFEIRLEASVRTFVRTFDLLPVEQAFAEGLTETARLAGGRGLCVEHGDLCRQNILMSETGIRIIDWTDCIPFSFPMHDILFFVTTYFLQARGGGGISNINRAFELSYLEENPYSAVVRRTLSRHSAQLGFGPDAFVRLMGLFLVHRSVIEHSKMVHCGRSGLLPQFNTLLAPPEKITMQQAVRQQIWVSMFRFLVARKHSFTSVLT